MKIVCSKSALTVGVQTVYRAVSSKANIQALSGILMETTTKGLRLVAYDMELGIETFVPVVVEREGSFVFPARYIAEIVRKITHSEVVIDFNEADMSVKVVSGSVDFDIKVMSAKDFPNLPDIASAQAWSLKEAEMKKMIKKTSIAVASQTDDSRTVLTGMLLAISPDTLTMVATDSFRLAHREIGFLSGLDNPKSVIIPAKTLIEVERNLSEDAEKELELALTERNVIIKLGVTTYISRILEGQFPNYKQVFQQNIPVHISMDKNLFLSSVERVSLLCTDDLSSIKFVYTGEEGSSSGFITITANTPEVGQAKEDIAVSIEGHADVTVALRARYIKDVLKIAEGDDVTINFVSARHAMEIKDNNDENYTYLVMPVTSVY